jgi:prolipoprotein diacylglyceryltransferase
MFGHIPISIPEQIASFFYELLIGTSIGYIILLNENKFHTKYKRTLYSGICAIFWLGVRSMIVDFRMEDLYYRNIIGAILSVGMSIFFGIVFVQISQWLMRKK